MIRKVLLVLASCLVPAGLGCITQEVNLCSPESHQESGELHVLPQWKDEESLTTYLMWMNDPKQRWKVEAFQSLMKTVVRRGLGEVFPKVEMPPVSDREAIALGLWGGDYKDVTDRSRIRGAASAYESFGDPSLEKIQEMLEAAVHGAVNGQNGDLHASNFEPLYREVTYVIEQGVTYCVYKTWVVSTAEDEPQWWECTWQDPESKQTITAYLDLMAIVRRIG